MMRLIVSLFLLCLRGAVDGADEEGGGLSAYGPVPGLSPSPYYSVQVRREREEPDSWLETFTLLSECTAEKFCNTTGMFEHLNGWSNSYLNFEIKEGKEEETMV